MCEVDACSSKTWTSFAPSKNHMMKFAKQLVTFINGLFLAVKYIWCDNTGEHQRELQILCVPYERSISKILFIYTFGIGCDEIMTLNVNYKWSLQNLIVSKNISLFLKELFGDAHQHNLSFTEQLIRTAYLVISCGPRF